MPSSMHSRSSKSLCSAHTGGSSSDAPSRSLSPDRSDSLWSRRITSPDRDAPNLPPSTGQEPISFRNQARALANHRCLISNRSLGLKFAYLIAPVPWSVYQTRPLQAVWGYGKRDVLNVAENVFLLAREWFFCFTMRTEWFLRPPSELIARLYRWTKEQKPNVRVYERDIRSVYRTDEQFGYYVLSTITSSTSSPLIRNRDPDTYIPLDLCSEQAKRVQSVTFGGVTSDIHWFPYEALGPLPLHCPDLSLSGLEREMILRLLLSTHDLRPSDFEASETVILPLSRICGDWSLIGEREGID